MSEIRIVELSEKEVVLHCAVLNVVFLAYFYHFDTGKIIKNHHELVLLRSILDKLSFLTMKHLASLLLSLLISNYASSQLQNIIENIRIQYSLMGISVVTVCDGEITGSYHSGLRDFTRNLPVDDNTMYRIASISKMVTAMGLLKIFETGRFNLDDDVSEYLGFSFRNPNWPNDPITFRMLLSHTSSFQDGSGYSSFLGATYNNPNPPNIQALTNPGGSYYTSNMWRAQRPGSFFIYSNANYGIIATLIERLSNVRFDIFMRENFFEPMGITGSYNVADLANNINDLAVLYRKSGGVWTPQVDNYQGIAPNSTDYSSYTIGTNGFIFSPQGGLRCSALDLAKIMQLHLNHGFFGFQPIISSSTLSEMHSPVWTFNGSNGDNYYGLFRSWGLGVQLTTNTQMGDIVYPDVPMIGHAGEAYGLISDLYFDPMRRAGIVFITNGSFYNYAYGVSSAFYLVEEEVFGAAYQHSYLSCTPTTIDTNHFDESISFPNPAKESIAIKTQCETSIIKYSILDVYGRMLLSGEICKNLQQINTSSLPAGAYLLLYSCPSAKGSIKFIKN